LESDGIAANRDSRHDYQLAPDGATRLEKVRGDERKLGSLFCLEIQTSSYRVNPNYVIG